jgi:hypothetical protein
LVTYVDLRTENRDDYVRAYAFMGIFPTFGPLKDIATFNQAHKACMTAVAQGHVEWSTMGEPESQIVIALIDGLAEIAIGILFPPLAPVAPFIVEAATAAIKLIIRFLTRSIHRELVTKGTYGASSEQHQAQVAEWANQAAAA